MTPCFLGRKRKDRSEQSAQRVENFMHDHLRRAAARRIRRVAVHSVLSDVDIEAAQIDSTKLVECVIALVELELFVSRSTISDDMIESLQNPAIDQRHSERRRGIPLRYLYGFVTGSLDFASLRSG